MRIEQDERAVYHLMDGSDVELYGAFIIGQDDVDGVNRYWLNSGKQITIPDHAIAYITIEKRIPETGDGIC